MENNLTYAVRVKCVNKEHIEEGKDLFEEYMTSRFDGKKYKEQKEFYYVNLPQIMRFYHAFSENVNKSKQYKTYEGAKELSDSLNVRFNNAWRRHNFKVKYKAEVVSLKVTVSTCKQ